MTSSWACSISRWTSSSMRMVPALGYLEQYQRLIERSQQGLITTAELSYLIARFDPAAGGAGRAGARVAASARNRPPACRT